MRAGDDHIKAWLPPSTKAEDMLLYTTPQPAAPAQPPRQGGARGLTDDQIADLWMYRKSLHDGNLMLQLRDFARAIERAQGSHAVACRAPACYHRGHADHQRTPPAVYADWPRHRQ